MTNGKCRRETRIVGSSASEWTQRSTVCTTFDYIDAARYDVNHMIGCDNNTTTRGMLQGQSSDNKNAIVCCDQRKVPS